MSLNERLARIEKQVQAEQGAPVVVLTDDYGHEEWPSGKPHGGEVLEIHLGGVDIEQDF